MNDINDQITSVIGAHGLWKNRLRQAIERGAADLAVPVVRDDHQCNFGKWLYGGSLTEHVTKSSHYKKCAELHRRFHIVASEILGLATTGKPEQASKAMEPDGEFSRLSIELTNAMLAWKVAATTNLASSIR